jgi:hypothetical protein
MSGAKRRMKKIGMMKRKKGNICAPTTSLKRAARPGKSYFASAKPAIVEVTTIRPKTHEPAIGFQPMRPAARL